MQKYGLQLRTKPAAASSSRPPLPPPRRLAAFGGDDDNDVEAQISRENAKSRALQKVEEQHKKALEEDPTVFDYDGVFDDMKEQKARPKVQDKTDRQPKYIGKLLEKAQQRKREQDIIYEKKLLKERSKEDHLYADKERFITPSFRKKLEEQQKWLEEERLRELREEKEDVTKKKDLSDFYFGLDKNVAFGARVEEAAKRTTHDRVDGNTGDAKPSKLDAEESDHSHKRRREDSIEPESAHGSTENAEVVGTTSKDSEADNSAEKKAKVAPLSTTTQATQATEEHYKRSADAVAAARERFLARKREKEQL